MSYGPRSCSWRLRASTTTRSGPVWTPAARSSPSGANASSPSGSAASRSDPGEDGQASFPPEVVIEVKAIACELPRRLGLPLSRLQVPDIRDEVITRGLVAAISGTTIWRWLATDAIRPWSHRSWIFPRAPDFEARAARVLDLYARQWQGEPLDAVFYECSADHQDLNSSPTRRSRPPAPDSTSRHA